MLYKIYGAAVGILIAAFSFYAGQHTHAYTSRATMIELGCGQYDQKSGDFQYVKAMEAVDPLLLSPLPVRKPSKAGVK